MTCSNHIKPNLTTSDRLASSYKKSSFFYLPLSLNHWANLLSRTWTCVQSHLLNIVICTCISVVCSNGNCSWSDSEVHLASCLKLSEYVYLCFRYWNRWQFRYSACPWRASCQQSAWLDFNHVSTNISRLGNNSFEIEPGVLCCLTGRGLWYLTRT